MATWARVPKDYPPEGQKFFKDYAATYGKKPEPYAIYGYEAMALLIDAMKAVGADCNNRPKVIDAAVRRPKDRESALGTYSIDANGDTTLTDYGLYRRQERRALKSVKVLKDA